jgi:hypothetical protein
VLRNIVCCEGGNECLDEGEWIRNIFCVCWKIIVKLLGAFVVRKKARR